MHARELVELAAIITAHGPVMIRDVEQLSESGLENYWVSSKVRLDRWSHNLKLFQEQAADTMWRDTHWPTMRGIFEEILSGEMLTRVWTGILCAHDRLRNTSEAEPIARSILLGHLEARHRVLSLLVRSTGIDTESATRLNTLRKRSERWSDLLMGYIVEKYDVSEFAVDPDRAKDFAFDLRQKSNDPESSGGRQTWPLVLASLRAAFQYGLAPVSPNADVNLQIASSILACFPSELFDSTGMFHSLWMLRMNNIAEDTQSMIDELFKMDSPLSQKAVS